MPIRQILTGDWRTIRAPTIEVESKIPGRARSEARLDPKGAMRTSSNTGLRLKPTGSFARLINMPPSLS